MSTKTPVYFYNTQSRSKELFQPLDPQRVTIYSCGPTVYKDIHIGNLRTFIMTDWVRRVLEYNQYNVLLVRNITDVGHLYDTDVFEGGEDKLEQEAKQTGRSAYEIAEFYAKQYFDDSRELNILLPHLNPKATEHIPEMESMIASLLEKGMAYERNGNIYFDVSKFPDYGSLSGNTVENLRENSHSRQQLELAADKDEPEDFALWKQGDASRQMNWESPWGLGFPGWHIECSAMATRYLGEQFDIHTGAIDLTFPHHEDEIAQSQSVSGKKPVQVWMHGEFLDFANSKMSRSVGNVILVSTLKEQGFEPLSLRYLLLTAHYRTKINFTEDSITAAQNGYQNLKNELAALPVVDTAESSWSPAAQKVRTSFLEATNNDLDLPTALVITRETLHNQEIEPAERRLLVLDFDRVLGLSLDQVTAKAPVILSEEVQELVRQRDAARVAKNWRASDEIRDLLKAQGFEVRDTPQGTQLF